jgi:hypothetical protein
MDKKPDPGKTTHADDLAKQQKQAELDAQKIADDLKRNPKPTHTLEQGIKPTPPKPKPSPDPPPKKPPNPKDPDPPEKHPPPPSKPPKTPGKLDAIDAASTALDLVTLAAMVVPTPLDPTPVWPDPAPLPPPNADDIPAHSIEPMRVYNQDHSSYLPAETYEDPDPFDDPISPANAEGGGVLGISTPVLVLIALGGGGALFYYMSRSRVE